MRSEAAIIQTIEALDKEIAWLNTRLDAATTPNGGAEIMRILAISDAKRRTLIWVLSGGGEPSDVCTWKGNGEGVWHGTCGAAWYLDTGTPKENKMGYCPQCGHPLVEDGSQDAI